MPQRSRDTDRVRRRIAMTGKEVDEWVIWPGMPDPWPRIPGPAEGTSVAIDFLDGLGDPEVQVLAMVDQLAVRISLEPASPGGGPAVAAVEVQRCDERPLGGAEMARVGLGEVYRQMGELMSHDLVVEHLGADWGAVRVPRPGRRGRDDLYYAIVARDYVDALAERPAAPVRLMMERSAEHATEDEIRARVRRARERGLLTRSPKGRAGGELTDEALSLLGEAGLLAKGDDHGER